MKTINIILCSVGSAFAGGFAGYFVGKKIYQKKADMERNKVSDSLRKYYEENYIAKPIKKKEKKSEETKNAPKGASSIDMSKGTEMKDYFNYTKKYQPTELKNEDTNQNTILVNPHKQDSISTDQRGKEYGYTFSFDKIYILDDDEIKTVGETICYTCYSDNKIADDDYRLVKDPNEKFGKGNIEKIFNNETDELYIRDPELGVVYHILKEDITYNQAAGKYTHMFSEPDDADYEDEYQEYADMYDPE